MTVKLTKYFWERLQNTVFTDKHFLELSRRNLFGWSENASTSRLSCRRHLPHGVTSFQFRRHVSSPCSKTPFRSGFVHRCVTSGPTKTPSSLDKVASIADAAVVIFSKQVSLVKTKVLLSGLSMHCADLIRVETSRWTDVDLFFSFRHHELHKIILVRSMLILKTTSREYVWRTALKWWVEDGEATVALNLLFRRNWLNEAYTSKT